MRVCVRACLCVSVCVCQCICECVCACAQEREQERERERERESGGNKDVRVVFLRESLSLCFLTQKNMLLVYRLTQNT